MIRNIVFDMAWVLFEYRPMDFLRKYLPEQDAELVNRELFCAPEWAQLDLGAISEEDYLAVVLGRMPPRLHAMTAYLYGHWHEMPTPIPDVERVVGRLKQNGYGIYLLTNMSSRFYRFYKKIPAVRYFDGMVVSADVHAVKPEPEIYWELFRRFGLKPEECFFIDDREENVQAGRKLGMRGFCFSQDAEELCAAMRLAGVRV